MKFVHTVMAASLTLALSGQTQAAVSATEAAKLGNELTLIGAEKAGNVDGSIPAYKGGLTTPPADFKKGDSMRPDPFSTEKPLLVIDGKNVDQYKGLLTATTAELARRYPSYRIEVYPTHRTASLPQGVLDNSVKNATGARSTQGGNAIENVFPGTPFPVPQSGAEAMWNHLLRYQGLNVELKYDSWNVDSTGTASLATTGTLHSNYPAYDDLSKPLAGTDVYYQTKLEYSGPARRAGEAVMLRDAVNPLEQPRRAWQYLPGQRRVKLAPSLDYDTPNPGTAGTATWDDAYVFNGALDRFDWKLIGKQEMIVPYNTYRVTYQKDVKPMLTPNHLAPEFLRWEKHRVWVVEATLKPSARHIYAKRRFYLDEDTWVALASDQYDANGKLYRGVYTFITQNYEQPVPNASPYLTYDLVAGSYSAIGLPGPYGGIKYGASLSKTQWSPESLAGAGIR
ncbi:DUF1329 domain-containing protein [Pseudomonas fluorescens]|uniref:DUF1329 domain-containing protein n=1 Tax=Pseudomonas fluorescens TaxID=294 RepID=UPI00124058CC|nr:DUF1329 domain-containing protein [Pseudomonas fluorescens]VVM78164.1 hypothetical protein PS639_02130 [Pseudomonas fluorescens]